MCLGLRVDDVNCRDPATRSTVFQAFDDTVVMGGNVPLDVLARNVDDYVRS